ncbi:formylglycine-generating enzyme family protein [Mesorhizobium sp. BR1-1-6]|uniref:formylglycine-generating enzyme family protein n=1 Tax=Mesorhizobium sp. BR1-1-6 TaxID=2876648 RepID=UPI0021E25B38|nr:SUMF1/EgtB/PvdO family nonheme iron enzyme [Mesorhizobium sp. BR1-1-6]
MHKVVAAIAVLVLALVADMGSISPSFAQQRCTEIGFPDKDTAVQSGLAPVDNCYELDAQAAAASSDARAGTPFRDCEHCPEMVPLPPGSFMMGASQKEMKRLRYVQWATPQHEVTIGYPFAIGRFEVTVDEFDAYVKETGAGVGGKCGIRTIESGPNKFKI